MFKHLLIPLDGSKQAEAAMPVATYLCERLNASATLVHVIEQHAPDAIHGEPHLRDAKEATEYLSQCADRVFRTGTVVRQHVHTTEVGNVARSLVQHSGEFQPDLIIMCSHGRGGLRDLFFGNIAQQVIALGKTPVLLVQPKGRGDGTWPVRFERMLVPLDGKSSHEHGLRVAEGLSLALGAWLHLAVVVPTVRPAPVADGVQAEFIPGPRGEWLDIIEQRAWEYLRGHSTRLQEQGLQVGEEVLRGSPAESIVECATRVGVELMVIGTHGKSGTEAFWSGSLPPRILCRTKLPVLLVPVGESA